MQMFSLLCHNWLQIEGRKRNVINEDSVQSDFVKHLRYKPNISWDKSHPSTLM